MKKVDDHWLRGMLLDEYDQCREHADSLRNRMKEFPAGKLGVIRRKNPNNNKIYEYHVLRYRNKQGNPVSMHVSSKKWPEIAEQIELRDNIRRQLKSFQDRMRSIDKLLGISSEKKATPA